MKSRYVLRATYTTRRCCSQYVVRLFQRADADLLECDHGFVVALPEADVAGFRPRTAVGLVAFLLRGDRGHAVVSVPSTPFTLTIVRRPSSVMSIVFHSPAGL